MNAIIAVFSMYFFIAIGFSAKKIFHEAIHAKTLNLLSVYFLQPFLTLWGLTQYPFDTSLFLAPLWYMAIVVVMLVLLYIPVKALFKEPSERSIALIAALIGNTGNLGIPLGIALFGYESVPYMTLINLMNVIVVYTFGVYIYSRGSFSVKESLFNIIKLPIIWFALVAVILNITATTLPNSVLDALKMGAFAAMTIQLILFGIYLYEAKLVEVSKKLTLWVMSIKFLLLPSVTVLALLWAPFSAEVKAMIFLELFMPLAVANINISSLYNSKPQLVTVMVFISSIIFLFLAPLIEFITPIFRA